MSPVSGSVVENVPIVVPVDTFSEIEFELKVMFVGVSFSFKIENENEYSREWFL